jgi:hypothetical protein
MTARRGAWLALAVTATLSVNSRANAERDRASTWRWLVSEAANNEPSTPMLAALVATRHGVTIESADRAALLARFAADPYAASVGPLVGLPAPDDAAVDALGPWSRPLAAALACSTRPLEQADFVGLFRPADEVDTYAAAHAMLGVAWAHERGCLAPADAEAAMCLARRVARAALAAAPDVGDARSELVAVSLYLGLDDLVAPGDIEAIEAGFGADGSWGPQTAENHYHATMVAAWAVEEWESRGETRPSMVATAPVSGPVEPVFVEVAAALSCDGRPADEAAPADTGDSTAAAPSHESGAAAGCGRAR